MNPQDFINTYGASQLAALVAFLLLLHRALRRRGAGLTGHAWLAGLCVLGAGIGARLHYLIEGVVTGRMAAADFGAVLLPATGGSTFLGATIGVAVVLVMARRSVPGGSLRRLADDAVPGIGVAVLIGRLGCLVHGCCLGQPSDLPWSLPSKLEFGPDAVRLHPLALYIGFWALASAVTATTLARRVGSRHGGPRPVATRFLLFAALFAFGRALMEPLRFLPPEEFAGASGASWEFLALGAAAIVLLATRHRSYSERTMTPARPHAVPVHPGIRQSGVSKNLVPDIDRLRPLE